jgi:NADH-quinone oxidoreductase subunit L
MELHLLALLLLALPLVSALLILFFFRQAHGIATFLSVGVAVGIAIVSGILIFATERPIAMATSWLDFGALSIRLGILFDDLAALMLAVVAVIGLLVHVFSLAYMKHEESKARYFGSLSCFMFSMLGLVLADDLIMLFIFWELVGLSSFLLINFYFTKPAAVAASKKAFIVNRIGDFGFLLGIITAYWAYGTIELAGISRALNEGADPTAATAIALFVFCGCIGKSGQIPLHVWLPDAMEGPTPVSALIHAATMVAAGIYLLARASMIMTEPALNVIAWVGIATAVMAGFIAIGQKDIKRILAYSTISQLGFMVAAFGIGSLMSLKSDGRAALEGITFGTAAAMFHLTTHAFFKALLFLGSGSIIHASHHEQDIYRLGGLRNRMPVTFVTFTIGTLALIGLPYVTAGFYSKDLILFVAIAQSPEKFALLALGAFLTAFYMTRLWVVTFLGEPRSEGAAHAHENGSLMTIPLIVLAILSVIGGFSALYSGSFGGVIEVVQSLESQMADAGKAHILVVSVGFLALIFAALAFWIYKPGATTDRLEQEAPGIYRALEARLGWDRVYDAFVAKVQQPFAEVLHLIEQFLLSGLGVRGTAAAGGLVGLGFKALHTGSVRFYALWFVLGAGLIWWLIA